MAQRRVGLVIEHGTPMVKPSQLHEQHQQLSSLRSPKNMLTQHDPTITVGITAVAAATARDWAKVSQDHKGG